MKRAAAIESGRIIRRRDPAVTDLANQITDAIDTGAIAGAFPMVRYPFYRANGWFFDFAWPLQMIAVDIGKHTLFTRQEKWDFAGNAGWRVFRFSPKEVRDGQAIAILARALAHPSLFKQ